MLDKGLQLLFLCRNFPVLCGLMGWPWVNGSESGLRQAEDSYSDKEASIILGVTWCWGDKIGILRASLRGQVFSLNMCPVHKLGRAGGQWTKSKTSESRVDIPSFSCVPSYQNIQALNWNLWKPVTQGQRNQRQTECCQNHNPDLLKISSRLYLDIWVICTLSPTCLAEQKVNVCRC